MGFVLESKCFVSPGNFSDLLLMVIPIRAYNTMMTSMGPKKNTKALNSYMGQFGGIFNMAQKADSSDICDDPINRKERMYL